MKNLNILIVEGNIREDSEFFIKAAGASAADNLKNLILKLEPTTNTDIINPGHDDETSNALKNMSKYNGIVFTGGAMRINDMTDVIKKHIKFFKLSAAEAPAAFMKNSLSSLMFPSTIRIFRFFT